MVVIRMAFSPDEGLAITCDQHNRAFFWRVSLLERGRLMGLYITPYNVGAIHWKKATQLLLADQHPKAIPLHKANKRQNSRNLVMLRT